MTTRDVLKLIHAEILQGNFDDKEIAGVYASDLLSDVLANGRESTVLITIQAHKNTVAVATVVDISLIILCNNRPIIDDMIEAAAQARVGVLRTPLSQFEVSGQIWQALHAMAAVRT
jgi:serine kinase of HPr protein (carbohydrate metabolism regulator)